MNVKKIALILIVIIALIQLKRIDTTNPEVISTHEYLSITKAPKEIAEILKNSCYDCHSHETKYPWYSNIAPVSWILKNHIDEGRGHLNFSEWGTYSEGRKNGAQEESIEELEKNKMPMKSYTFIHAKAKLSENDKATLIKWFQLQTRSE